MFHRFIAVPAAVVLCGIAIVTSKPTAQTFTAPRAEAQIVRFEQSGGGTIVITYDLVASDSRAMFEVLLDASQDQGKTFAMRPKAVSGDVGSDVRPGTGKRIVWEWARDTERIEIDQIRFRIIAIGRPLAPAPTPALKIVVLQGEDAVNIIQQKTVVAPLVEVRDRNNLPVSGAVVTFTVGAGKGATFRGATTLAVTTNAAGQASAAGFTPTAAGTIQVNAIAVFDGQTAIATITQTNVMTAAEAAAAAGGGAGSGGGAGGSGGAAGASAAGGGLSAAAIAGIVGGVAAGGLAIGKAAGGGGSGNGTRSGTGTAGSGTTTTTSTSTTSTTTTTVPPTNSCAATLRIAVYDVPNFGHGAVGATVEIRDTQPGNSQSGLTNASGDYLSTPLGVTLRGNYNGSRCVEGTVTASMSGFTTVSQDYTIQPNQTVQLMIQLRR